MNLQRFKSHHLSSVFFVLFCLLFSLVEVGFFREQSTAKLGVILWYLMLILLFIFVLFELTFILKQSIKYKIWLTPLSLFTIIFITLCFYANQPSNLSLEAPQQIACALDKLNSPDYGFFSNCFLGYPTRQYYLPLIPSLFTHSLFNLHLGNYLYMIIGFIVFTGASMRWSNLNQKSSDLKIATLLHIPLHFYYFNYLNLTFEQAFYPVGLGLALVGMFINLKVSFNYKYLFIFISLSLILVSTYTTSLALLPLVGLAILFLAWKNKSNKKTLIGLAICLCTLLISFFISLNYREDLPSSTQTENTTITAISNTIKIVFNLQEERAYTSPVFSFFWLTIWVSILIGKFKLPGYIVLGWCIVVFYASISAVGYTTYGLTFSLHRTIIIIPILQGLLLYFRFNPFTEKFLWIFTGIIIFTGYYYQYNHFQTKDNTKSVILHEVYTFSNTASDTMENSVLYLVNTDKEPYIPISDGAGYFLNKYDIHKTNDLCEIDTNSTVILVSLGEINNNNCYETIKFKITYTQTNILSNDDIAYLFKLN